jgi:hypothetical protein
VKLERAVTVPIMAECRGHNGFNHGGGEWRREGLPNDGDMSSRLTTTTHFELAGRPPPGSTPRRSLIWAVAAPRARH